MLSYERELESLRPILGDARTDDLLAHDRREVFSLHPELRILAWAGAMLLAAAAGLVLKNNLDRLGPVVLALMMAAAAAACYAFVWWHRERAGLADDYVLLLGALVVSADVAFVESQFHFFGDAWHRHFLILAMFHGITAYVFRSRLVLSLAITATAAWLGVREDPLWQSLDYANRASACAALLLAWRGAHQQFDRERDFAPTLEHFAANIAFAGSIALMTDDDTIIFGCVLMLAIAAAVAVWGVRTRREIFVLYSFIYAVIAVDVLFVDLIDSETLTFPFVILSVIAAIAGLFAIHARVKEWRS
jgi:Predicted membrane protein (DUF2157)